MLFPSNQTFTQSYAAYGAEMRLDERSMKFNSSIRSTVQFVQQFNSFKSSIGSRVQLVQRRFNLGTIFQMKNHSIAFEVIHFSSHDCLEKSLDWWRFSKGSGLDTPPASALDLLLILGS
jgi:hypothetical protein